MSARGDWMIAIAATAIAVAEIATTDRVSDAARLGALAVAVLVALSLAWRRRRPLEVLAFVTAVLLAGGAEWEVFADGAFIALPLLIGIYTAARHESGARLAAAAALTAATAARVALEEAPRDVGDLVGNLIFAGLIFGVPFGAGRLVRSQQLRVESTEAGSEERARRAAAEERARIARELHDVVGHSLSVIAVQAGVERKLLADRGTPSETLETVERVAREALGEMRRLLGMLRRDDAELALAPQPSLDGLEQLAEQVRAAGLPVAIEFDGERRPLAPGIDLSAYRIVQEALTNALKHAGPARARVRVAYGPDAVVVEVADDGRGTGDTTDAGHGLAGMRERVSLYGGSLRTGQTATGGFIVSARLPLA